MNKCSYCGMALADDALKCPLDGHQAENASPELHRPRPLGVRRPIFGILSIGMPATLILLFLGAMTSDLFGDPLLAVLLYAPLVPPLSGLAFAVTGLIRGERLIGLAYAGLALNCFMLIWFAIAPKNDWHM